MPNINIPLPLKGYSEGFNLTDASPMTTGDIMNVRPVDSLESRLRLGQRPGLLKAYDEQIASVTGEVVEIGSITIVDYQGVD